MPQNPSKLQYLCRKCGHLPHNVMHSESWRTTLVAAVWERWPPPVYCAMFVLWHATVWMQAISTDTSKQICYVDCVKRNQLDAQLILSILCVLDRASSWYLNKGRPTWWHLLYYVNLLLNMFRMLIHPSSGACDYLVHYCVGCNVLNWGVLVLCSGIGFW